MARDWNGSSHYGTAAAAAASFDTGSWAGWFQPDFDPSTTTGFHFVNNSGVYAVVMDGANNLEAEFDSRILGVNVTGLWSAGTWTHFAVVYNKTGSVIKVYINGTDAGGSQTGTWGANTLGGSMRLGVNGGATGGFFDGDCAEVATWSVVLDAAEIAALAKGISPQLIRPQSALVYWPLGGNDSPEFDRGANKYDLTLTGPPTKSDHPRMYYPDGAIS